MKRLITVIFVLCILSAHAQLQIGNDIDGEAAEDFSGYAVSLSADGKRVAIGAPSNDGNGNNSGHARIYAENNGVWNQIGADINGIYTNDGLGRTISLSADGKRVAVAAPTSSFYIPSAGYILVFEEINGAWSQIGFPIEGDIDDRCGEAIALSPNGKRLVASSTGYGSTYGAVEGRVRIFEEDSGSWNQVGADIIGENPIDWSGSSVAFSYDGKRVAIGNMQPIIRQDSGYTRIFEEIGGVWTKVGNNIVAEAFGDGSGRSVSLSSDGKRIVIGASGNDGNGIDSGHARVYEENAGVWTQIGNDIDGEFTEDWAYVVSISADGKIVALGSSENDGNGVQSGHVRVFTEINGVWSQKGTDFDGEAAGDFSGYAVSLSADGSRLAVGAIQNGGNGINAGHVRVYGDLSVPVKEVPVNDLPGISLTPNPTEDRVTITVNTDRAEMFHLQFINLLGQTVLTESWNLLPGVNSLGIDLKRVVKGNYLVRIINNERSLTQKLLVR